jgi:hypothetical protein
VDSFVSAGGGMTMTLPSSTEGGAATRLTASLLTASASAAAAQLARLDATDHPFGAAALLARHLARDITVEVDTGAASGEAFLVRQTIDVSLQCGIDLPRTEHATRHQVLAYADLQRAVCLPWFGGEGSREHRSQRCDASVGFCGHFTALLDCIHHSPVPIIASIGPLFSIARKTSGSSKYCASTYRRTW